MGSVGSINRKSNEISFQGETFELTNYYKIVDGQLHRNIAAGLINENRRPTRVAGNYNIYIDSHPDVALSYSIYLIGDKRSGAVYRTEFTHGLLDQRAYIKDLVEELKRR